MRACVIVPTFQRSDFLFVCIERIKAATTLPVHVFPDRGTDESEVCDRLGVDQHLTLQHSYHGNTYNVLEALKWAYHQAFERVYVVEDDAIVDPTFFSWADQALAKHPDAFAACGWEYSPDAVKGDGPDLMIPWYLSVCAALPRASLFAIVQHAKPEYYGQMKAYADQSFPASIRRGSNHYEQDGLTLRVCESEGKRCVWPRQPRAIHIGWHGYHAPGKPLSGSLDDRVTLVRMALREPGVLRQLMAGGAAPDIVRCRSCGTSLLADKCIQAEVLCISCFHRQHPELPVCASTHYYLKPITQTEVSDPLPAS